MTAQPDPWLGSAGDRDAIARAWLAQMLASGGDPSVGAPPGVSPYNLLGGNGAPGMIATDVAAANVHGPTEAAAAINANANANAGLDTSSGFNAGRGSSPTSGNLGDQVGISDPTGNISGGRGPAAGAFTAGPLGNFTSVNTTNDYTAPAPDPSPGYPATTETFGPFGPIATLAPPDPSHPNFTPASILGPWDPGWSPAPTNITVTPGKPAPSEDAGPVVGGPTGGPVGAPGMGDVTGGYSTGYGSTAVGYGGDIAGGPGTGFGTGTGPGTGGYGDPGGFSATGLSGPGFDSSGGFGSSDAAAGFSAGFDAGAAVAGGFDAGGSGEGGGGGAGGGSK